MYVCMHTFIHTLDSVQMCQKHGVCSHYMAESLEAYLQHLSQQSGLILPCMATPLSEIGGPHLLVTGASYLDGCSLQDEQKLSLHAFFYSLETQHHVGSVCVWPHPSLYPTPPTSRASLTRPRLERAWPHPSLYPTPPTPPTHPDLQSLINPA